MGNVVGVTRGSDILSSFEELLTLTGFDEALLQAQTASGKGQRDFKIAIKPNMMVFMNPKAYTATVTDKDLVEYLVDHILSLGFRDIALCEAQHDVGRMLNNHNVRFVASKIGYQPRGRYAIADLSLEALRFDYAYVDRGGRLKTWRDVVGKTWKEADFRISFAKCKTHEHDWMTLGVKNVYGCFPATNKIARYHIRNEVFEVTGRSLRNFPVHFCFVDGWLASDGFQGYKIPHPRPLQMLFGGNNVVAVDMEIFERAGLDPGKSKMLREAVCQLYGGAYPQYVVRGDQTTCFDQLGPWENISDQVVARIDILEEVYISWAVLNLKPMAEVADFETFPPKNFVTRLLVWVFKLIWQSIRSFFTERPGRIIGSAFVLLMLWGYHGQLELLGLIWPAWRGPGIDVGRRPPLIPGLPWDNELISFMMGLFLLVLVPILLIRLVFKQPLSDYGLGLPPKERRPLALATFLTFTLFSLPGFWLGAHDPNMRQVYPFFKSFSSTGGFLLYELSYLPFFIAIEFIFRGYLLFGLADIRDEEVPSIRVGVAGPLFFGKYAILIQMLSYTAWHLGKPLPELWGTLAWGLAAGATAYAVRSIWPVVLSHWLLNVFLDAAILFT